MSYMMEQSANLSKAQAHANTHSLYLFLTDTHTLSLPLALQLALIFLTDRKWVEWMSQAHIPMTFSLSLSYTATWASKCRRKRARSFKRKHSVALFCFLNSFSIFVNVVFLCLAYCLLFKYFCPILFFFTLLPPSFFCSFLVLSIFT